VSVIVGLGVDIIEIGRMRRALARHPRMRERCFSAEERAYCEGRNRPEVHYALRFAAKEAGLKALGTGFAGMRFTDVEVVRDPKGRPVPQLAGRVAGLAAESGIAEIMLSLSYTRDNAVASAVAMTADPGNTAEPTPRQRMAASFKDARAILDEVDAEE